MIKSTFYREQETVWLKGNIHTHSNYSDGRVAPDLLALGYKDRGYDFLAITDHDVFMNYNLYCNVNIILLPAMELTAPITSEKNAHLVIIQKGNMCDFTQGQRFNLKNKEETLQFIEEHYKNNLIILNHPYWSLLE